jgi:hypothetical protein
MLSYHSILVFGKMLQAGAMHQYRAVKNPDCISNIEKSHNEI